VKSFDEIKSNPRLKNIVQVETSLAGTVYMDGWKGSFVFGGDECGWEHLSVSPYNHKKMPSWEDLCKLKDMFWKDDEACIQIHPKKSEYVNIQKNCLHIWRNTKVELPK